MITALLAAKIQKGTAIPAPAVIRPLSAGPAARPTLKPTPFKAVALSRSCLGTRSGVVDPQAGEVSAPPTPSRKVVASRSAGVARCRDTRLAKITETARIASSTAISNRRESMTSASAPAGSVNKNRGKLTATWTRDAVIGLASRLVISHPDAVSNIAVPTFDRTLAVHMTVNATELNAPHREGPGWTDRRPKSRSSRLCPPGSWRRVKRDGHVESRADELQHMRELLVRQAARGVVRPVEVGEVALAPDLKHKLVDSEIVQRLPDARIVGTRQF